jgi:hypothetical protein
VAVRLIVVTHDEVRAIALSLPGVVEGEEEFGFGVVVPNKKTKGIVWLWRERVAPKKPKVPNPGVIVIRVCDLEEKAALLAATDGAIFTEPHYDGYPAILVRLDTVDRDELAELITDSWRSQAPPAVVAEYDGGIDG